MNLILGFLKPNEGQILLDGNNVNENINSWHKNVSYVPQDIFLLNDTIRNNILFGLSEKNLSKKSLKNLFIYRI